MTDLKSAILAFIYDKIEHSRNISIPKQITLKQSRLLFQEGIIIKRDSRYWLVYQHGNLIAKAERRWGRTKTNPKPRELKPHFKERF